MWVGAGGIVSTTALSGLTLSGGTLTASGGGSTNALTNASPTTSAGQLMKAVDRVGMTNSGLSVDSTGALAAPTNAFIQGTGDVRYLKLSGGVASSSLLRVDANTNLAAANVSPNVQFDGTTLSVTNLSSVNLTNQIYLERLAVASATGSNALDMTLQSFVAMTNGMANNFTNQIINQTQGASVRFVAYGAGIMGGTATNAYQLSFKTASTNTIFWPPGSTNGNYDILVNSNQVVFVDLFCTRMTNIGAAYTVTQ